MEGCASVLLLLLLRQVASLSRGGLKGEAWLVRCAWSPAQQPQLTVRGPSVARCRPHQALRKADGCSGPRSRPSPP